MANGSATSTKVDSSTDQSKVEIPIKTVQKAPTANDWNKMLARVAELENKQATGGKDKKA